ncbi:MAG: hypothetical protein K8T89_15650, partial [Planctomycetes bacterium]|nr:hypothetical protein [Planctomycetota bacterium]
MKPDIKRMTDFLVDLGIEKVGHTQKTYLSHLISVHRFMNDLGCTDELCWAGMFHSIYGTERFQGFKLELDQRPVVRDLIGERAERLAYLNCAMNRETFDSALERDTEPYVFTDRITSEQFTLTREDFDDLCKIHLYDWLEQAPRSRFGMDYRRAA